MKKQGLSYISKKYMIEKIEKEYEVKISKKFDEEFEKHNEEYVTFINKCSIDLI